MAAGGPGLGAVDEGIVTVQIGDEVRKLSRNFAIFHDVFIDIEIFFGKRRSDPYAGRLVPHILDM